MTTFNYLRAIRYVLLKVEISNPKSPDYGKPLVDEQFDIFLAINELLKNILRITCDIVVILLPKRNIQDDNFITSTFDESITALENILIL